MIFTHIPPAGRHDWRRTGDRYHELTACIVEHRFVARRIRSAYRKMRAGGLDQETARGLIWDLVCVLPCEWNARSPLRRVDNDAYRQRSVS